MRIDAHGHGMHAEMGPDGKRIPPAMHGWQNPDYSAEEHIKRHNELGIEKTVLLDPGDIVFELKEIFGDFVIPCPMVEIDEITPEDIEKLFKKGAVGIKFIAPMKSYGDNSYLPLYEVIRDNKALAIFHTGFLLHTNYDPGGFMPRPDWIDIANMRPAGLDRISRALPDLKIQMAHFGKPWWDEALAVMQGTKNIYADLSGGFKKSLNMWKELLAPDGKLEEKVVAKLCYGSDGSMCSPGCFQHEKAMAFSDGFYDILGLSDTLRKKIDRENILMLTELNNL